MTACHAWCLDCGQSFDVAEFAEFGEKWRCVYCAAPPQRLIPSATPIQPAVIDGRPVVYSALVRTRCRRSCAMLACGAQGA